MLKFATRPLIAEQRSTTYTIIIGVWLLVTIYAIIHDQYIVRIAPEHFTIYHAPIWHLEHPHAIAAAWAFKAAVLPGTLLGIASAAFARHGNQPRISVRATLLGCSLVLILTELVAFGSGLWVRKTNSPLYPESFYPSQSLTMLRSQTIQVSCYLAAAIFSTLWLISIRCTRRRASTPAHDAQQGNHGSNPPGHRH
jgi:hypothetical protein